MIILNHQPDQVKFYQSKEYFAVAFRADKDFATHIETLDELAEQNLLFTDGQIKVNARFIDRCTIKLIDLIELPDMHIDIRGEYRPISQPRPEVVARVKFQDLLGYGSDYTCQKVADLVNKKMAKVDTEFKVYIFKNMPHG